MCVGMVLWEVSASSSDFAEVSYSKWSKYNSSNISCLVTIDAFPTANMTYGSWVSWDSRKPIYLTKVLLNGPGLNPVVKAHICSDSQNHEIQLNLS